VKQDGQADKVYYACTDHLGSIVKLVDGAGTEVFAATYDAWGKRTVTNNAFAFHRGYTGHEHLSEFDLINMNGRLYDPTIGRFLSCDPYVQAPDFSQNLNRYSYCLNNPLKFTDPEGEFFWVSIIIGAAMGGILNGIQAEKNGENFWTGAWKGAFVGAIGGALSNFGGGTFLQNVLWGTRQGAITGGLGAALNGEDLKKGMLYGAAIGAGFAALQSGIEAYGNYHEGYGFRTNDDLLNRLVKNANVNGAIDPANAQKAIDFVQLRYKLTGTNITYDKTPGAYGETYLNGNIKIGNAAFGSPSLLKATMIHEYTHYFSDRIFGNGKWQWDLKNASTSNYNDGVRGYGSEIRNSGRMHINVKTLKMLNPDQSYANPLWHQKNILKYLYTIPRRF
jgi:RHS repeat-associated protein